MKEDILSHIQNNREVSRIYSELKAGFLAYNRVTLPKIREEDREEIDNDSFIDRASRGDIQAGKGHRKRYLPHNTFRLLLATLFHGNTGRTNRTK